jgi:hypothetical protein
MKEGIAEVILLADCGSDAPGDRRQKALTYVEI